MPQLSDSQLVVLTAACQRPDRCTFPITARLKGNAAGNVLKSLLNKSLINEVRAKRDDPVWRHDEERGRITLVAAKAAFAALGIDPRDEDEDTETDAADSAPTDLGQSSPVTGASSADRFPTSFARVIEDALHRPQRLDELKLLAFEALAIDQPPSVRLAFGDTVAVRLDRCGQPLLLGRHSDDAVGSDLRHSASCRFRFEIGDELVEIDIVADVKADVHHARKGGTHMVKRPGRLGLNSPLPGGERSTEHRVRAKCEPGEGATRPIPLTGFLITLGNLTSPNGRGVTVL